MTADTSSPLDAVKTAGALLSFGLAHNWTFEQGFKKHNAGAIIHGYDHTVSFRTVLAYSFGQLLRAIARLNAGHLRKAFAWIDYKLFFRADRVHSDSEFGVTGRTTASPLTTPLVGCQRQSRPL